MPSCDFNNFDNCTCADCAIIEEMKDFYRTHCLRCKILFEKQINFRYCEECEIITNNEKKEEEEKYKKRKEKEELKRNDFLNKQNELFQKFYINIDKNNIELVPIKIINSDTNYINELCVSGVNKKFMSMKLMDVQKIKGKWYINKNKVELFYNLNMQNYYIIYDPRVHRYHLRK